MITVRLDGSVTSGMILREAWGIVINEHLFIDVIFE